MRFGLPRRFRSSHNHGDELTEEVRLPGEDPTPAPATPRPVPPVVLPRWMQLVLLPLAIVGLWALARAAGTVLLILVAASTFALILNPVVKMINRRGIPRG